MALTFAGVGLNLLPDEYAEWLDTYHTVADFPLASVWGYAGYETDHLPLPAPPLHREPPEVGTLYWPNGVTRCGLFCCVASSDRIARIGTALGADSAGPATLSMTDPTNNRAISVSMYVVGVRPLSRVGTENGAALLVLADKRWYLRQRTGTPSDFSSWSALLQDLASQLGITLTVGTVNSAYCAPDPERWGVQEKPLAPILEAACKAIGHNLVANRDGTFKTVSYQEAALEVALEKLANQRRTAGGYYQPVNFALSVPASVKIVFQNGNDPEAAPYTVTKTLSSLGLTEFLGKTGVTGQQATVYAEIAYNGSPGSVDAYATRAATDWYLWQLTDPDITFPTIADWRPTGFEDHIEWKYRFGEVLTRVYREPYQVLPYGTFGGADLCTTTTTAAPCTGRCKWNWNNTTKTWVLDSTTCSTGCKCFAPDWCPNPSTNNSNLCTFTDCGWFTSDQTPPNCTGTTTTTTTTTGGTTTTPTLPPGCTAGCDWYCHPSRGWVLRTNGCSPSCPRRSASPCPTAPWPATTTSSTCASCCCTSLRP